MVKARTDAAGELSLLERAPVDRSAAAEPAPDRCIHQLVEAQAKRRPNAVALTFPGARLSYFELNRLANRLAARLRRLGVGPETTVGLCVERSPEAVLGFLGVLKAGGVYVPLNPAHPADRLAFMLEDAGVRVLLRQASFGDRLPPFGGTVIELSVAEMGLGAASGRGAPDADANPETGVGLGNLAYVMYTSGSTGRPKGVLVEHRGLANTVCAQVHTWGIRPDDRVVQFLNLSFDAAQAEIFRALVAGATLCLPPPETLPGRALFHFLRDERITLYTTLPSVIAALPLDEDLPDLRTVTLGGESCPAELAAHWGRGRRILIGYGPTEATVCATIATDWDPREPPPIGRPIANTQAYILDEELRPVPNGSPGELYLGGAGVTRGYVNLPHVTAAAFVPDPFSDRPGARLYRTGDLARWRSDGNLEFLGRVDAQVKVRGYRIELGEVEAALGQHPNVRHGVVLAREDSPGDKRLVGYVVAQQEPAPSARELRRFLKDRLPDYMVPANFFYLAEMPRTANGKADRKSLPAPDLSRPELDGAYVAPRDTCEATVAGVWAQVLRLQDIGIYDNFFELGGNSLLATQAVARLRETLGREVPLRALFEEPTIAGLARRLGEMDGASTPGRPPLVRAPASGQRPLSFSQHRLWFVDQLEPGNPLYNLPAALRLNGALNVTALEQALREIVRRHEVLRTTFASRDGQAVQCVHPEIAVGLSVIDLAGVPEESRESRATELARAEALKAFDLARGPLIRPVLLRLGAADHLLLPTMHHIASDAWSLSVFTRELAALYEAIAEGKPSPLPDLPVQYADFAVWQRGWLQGEVLDSQLAYWRRRLANLPHALELPTDRPRPAVQRFHGGQHVFTLPRPLAQSLDRLSLDEGVTLFMTLLAAYQALLARYSGQEDIAVGTPVAGRDHPLTEGLIGFFVNVLVLRAHLSVGVTFRELLHQVRETCLGAFAHQDVPFERIVDELKPQRDLSRSPLFQAAFILQNAPPPTLRLPGVTLRQVDVDQGTSKSDLSLSMTATAEGLVGRLVYNTDLFEPATIARMARHFQTLVEGAVDQPDLPAARLPLLTPRERRQLVTEWNVTAADLLPDRCVHQLFEGQVQRAPDATALVSGGRAFTYGELNRRANRLARDLQRHGVGPETTVGLVAERSPEAVIGILATLKAGGAYMPADPTFPPDRVAFMLRDAGVHVTLAGRRCREGLPPDAGVVIELDPYGAESGAGGSTADDANPPCGVGPDNLAYVIYTSGSTGRPKGVLVPHRGLTNVIAAQVRAFGLGPGERLSQFVSLHFDAAQAELFRALASGATAFQAPPDVAFAGTSLAGVIRGTGFTMIACPPSALSALAEEDMATVRTLIVAGEACPPDLAGRWARGRRLWNAYGPTETTVCATLGTDWDLTLPPPIGRPVANTQAYVLDRLMQPVPVGVAGELYIGGVGVTRGYLNLPELTAAAFVPDPFGGVRGARLYRTGDLARWRADGNLEFLGRVDSQVKVRGYRIELGEVEAALRQHPALADNVVVAREDTPGVKRLVAYVVPARTPVPTAAELRDFLRARLPDYMVAAAFVPVPVLPLLVNGKVDRKSLPAPDADPAERDKAFVAPRNAAEETLAGIWAAVLRRPRVGVHDNFFELGGDSISSIQVIARANQAGLRLSAKDLFQHQTVAELAAAARAVPDAAPPGDDAHAPEPGVSPEELEQLLSQIGGPAGGGNLP
jgi:amino acid adenylation domain-containing protein